MHLNNQALYADISRYNWGIKCEKVIDRLSFRGCLLGVCSANSVTLSGKSGASSDKAEDESVAGATSRTRTPSGVSSGWREPMVICGTDH